MKADKSTKPDAKKPQDEPELPFFVEVGFTLPAIFLVLTDLAVAGVSFMSGASWLDIFIRTAVTTVSVGLVLWLLSMNWSNGMLEGVVRAALEESQAVEKPTQSGAAREA